MGCVTMREKILISKIVMLHLYVIFFKSHVHNNHKYGTSIGRLIPGLEMKAPRIRTWCNALALLRQLKVCNLHTLKCMSWVYLFWEIMAIWGLVVLEGGWVYILANFACLKHWESINTKHMHYSFGQNMNICSIMLVLRMSSFLEGIYFLLWNFWW